VTPRMKAAQALENTPAWQQTPWRDADSSAQHSVTAKPAYEAGGAPCREFAGIWRQAG